MSNPVAKRPQNVTTFADVVVFVLSFLMFLAGLALFGFAMSSPAGTELYVFWAGLLVGGFAFLVPMVYHWVRDRKI